MMNGLIWGSCSLLKLGFYLRWLEYSLCTLLSLSYISINFELRTRKMASLLFIELEMDDCGVGFDCERDT